jgi:hypothetical protein
VKPRISLFSLSSFSLLLICQDADRPTTTTTSF